MYVLVIGRAYPDKETGMMGIFEYEQAKSLAENGCKSVYAFCDTRSVKRLKKYGYINKMTDEINIYGYHLPIGGLPPYIFSKIKKLHYKRILDKLIKNEGMPDVIHIHFPLLTLTYDIWEMLKNYNRPIVVTEHWTRVQIKDLEPYRIRLLNKIVDEASEFICVSEKLGDSIKELTGTNREIKVIPNMVSPLFYYERKKNNKEYYEFITVGRLVEVKRFDLVIEAFAEAFKNNNNVRLTIVGGGPLNERLKEKISSVDMNDRITMLGFLTRNETAKRVRESDAFVSGSELETFGVPFIEAMASGKPVIGIQNGPIDKYITKDNGIKFKSGSKESLALAMKRLYNDRDRYNEEQISEYAAARFSQKAVAENLKAIYSRI